MEKLKNLINPGSTKDDEVMYGSGRSDDPAHSRHTDTGSVQAGSDKHFGSSRTVGQDSLSTPSNVAGTSQNDTATPGVASHGLSEPYASRMPGSFDDDDAATTASVSSGIPGHSQSRSAVTGPNDPTFTEKHLPLEPASDTGVGQGHSSLTGHNYPDRSIEDKSRHGDHSGSSHLDRDASLGAGAAKAGAHRHEEPQRYNYASETDRSFPLGGSSAIHKHGSTTAGPHSSSLANNKADARVDSDGSRTAGNIGYTSTSAGYRSNTRATPSSGAGVGAVGHGPESWQHEHGHHGHQFKGDPCESETPLNGPHFVSGPHVTDTANRLDPHVGSGVGGSAPSDHSDSTVTPQDRLAGSGHQSVTAPDHSPYPSSSHKNVGEPRSGLQSERDFLAAGPIGTGPISGGDQAQISSNHASETQVPEHQPSGASTAYYPPQGHVAESEKGYHKTHSASRDAALVGGHEAGLGASTSREYPYKEGSQGHHDNRPAVIVEPGIGATPYENTGQNQHASRDTAASAGAGAGAGASTGHATSQRDVADFGAKPSQGIWREQSTGRDAAILGGVAGAGGLVEHEYSKKEASKLQKEHAKEEKAFEKEASKELKHHNRELAKEDKAHDKAIDKSEKKHEKAVGKEETTQEHGGKKHGGILGFLHRDKPDKELKEDEARRQGIIHPGRGHEEGVAGADGSGLESYHDPLQGEHGSQSGVHESTIGMGSGSTTHDAYGAHDTGHNKLHKNPPSKVVESRGYELQ